ncbi:MAG: cell division protein ZapE [Magnetococcales bacterium]|nr:cell division protein ZapE [Magnetococcales bacterium]
MNPESFAAPSGIVVSILVVVIVLAVAMWGRRRRGSGIADPVTTSAASGLQPSSPAPEPLVEKIPEASAPPLSQPGFVTPSRLYHELLEDGELRPDKDQLAVLPILDGLVAALRQPAVRGKWRGVEVWRLEDQQPVPRGLYLFGSVGRGKSMLMQLVFDATEVTAKRRVHFQPFMRELQERMHQSKPPQGVDLLLFIASQIAADARLLCFDEFCVTNIADAMLLGRLLEALFKCGVTLCATSNWPPEDLYQEGLNRGRFMPFIKILTDHALAVNLSQGADWRRDKRGESSDEEEQIDTPEALYAKLTGVAPKPELISLQGMEIVAHGVEKRVFWFDFNTLCNQAIGVAEYMDLVQQTGTVIISGVPKLGPETADAAMRLVVLIDLLYESRTPLRIFSAVPLDHLCETGPVAFAFQRSISRMYELMHLVSFS